MLTTYFTRERTRATDAAGPTGPYLDDLSHWLEKRGFTTRTIRRCLFGATPFAAWAAAAGIPVPCLDATRLEAFRCSLTQHDQLRYASGNPTSRCMGAHHCLSFLSTPSIISASPVVAPTAALPALLNEFQDWMAVPRGVTKQTLRNYRPILLDLLTTLGDRPAQLEAKSLRPFILDRAHRHGKGTAKNVVTATRLFVRFLIARGRCRPGLDDAIPTSALWRLATLPQDLPADDVARIITACNPSSPWGARDHAIVLLMARFGLRGSDVVGVRFTDINWQDAPLLVSGKSRRETRRPLPQDVGDALWHYWECARPPVDSDRVFITTMAPWGRSHGR